MAPDPHANFDLVPLQRLLAKQDAAAIDIFAALREHTVSRMEAESFGHLPRPSTTSTSEAP